MPALAKKLCRCQPSASLSVATSAPPLVFSIPISRARLVGGLYQRSMILTHAGDSHGLRIVFHHGELREVLHGGSDRASGRLYGG